MKFNFKKWPAGWYNMDKIESLKVLSSATLKELQPGIKGIKDGCYYILAEKASRDGEAKNFFIDYKEYLSREEAEKALDEMMFSDSEEEASSIQLSRAKNWWKIQKRY